MTFEAFEHKAALAAFGIGAGAMAIAYIFPVGLMLMPALLAFAGTVWGYGGLAIAAITGRRRHNMHSGNCGLEHNRRAGDVHTRGHSDDLYFHK